MTKWMNSSLQPLPLPVWRSILFVPAHIQRFVDSAHLRGADAIQLDLEDSVPHSAKAEAREILQSGIDQLSAKGVDVVVRVNRDLRNCVLDLDAAVRPGVKAITLPKVMGADHVRLIDELVSELELSRGLPVGDIRLIALIETIDALLGVEELAKACPRLSGIALGSEDLSFDGGFEPTSENLFNPCQRLVYAARSAHIQAWGFPGSIAEYSDLDLFSSQVRQAKSMGFNGAFCIHPKQVEIINTEYSVSDDDIQRAQKIVEAFDAAVAQQRGAIELDGKMVDLPVVERAREVLAARCGSQV